MTLTKRDEQSRIKSAAPRRRTAGFTLVELLVAGVITAFVLGSVSMSLSQLGRAKNTSKLRFDAFIRADSALNLLRKEIVAVTRSDDLFYSRFLLTNDSVKVGKEQFDRDQILVFNTRLRPLRNIDFGGEGFEYESQFRIADDDLGPMLWARHDHMPDEYPEGGGVATPEVEGVIGLAIEAYDGYAWFDEWDSDTEGLPLAVRITVQASGHRGPDDIYSAPRALLRTIVSIDRVISPKDLFKVDDSAQDDTGTGADDGSGNNPDANGEMGGMSGGDIAGGAGGLGGRGGGPGAGPGRGDGRGGGRGSGGGNGGGGGISVPGGGTVTGTGTNDPQFHPHGSGH